MVKLTRSENWSFLFLTRTKLYQLKIINQSLQTQTQNKTKHIMSTVMNIINERALVAAITEFGERLGANFSKRLGASPEDDARPVDLFQLALEECLKELPQQKVKATKAKVAKGPSKTAQKKAEMLDQLAELGGIAPEDDSLKSIRQAISARKKEIKAEEKATKAAEKKAAKLKAASEKKAAKKASPKLKDFTQRRLKSADGNDILGISGTFLRVNIHKENRTVLKIKEDNWTDEAHARYQVLYPAGKDVKKSKISKKKAPIKVAKKGKITKKKSVAEKKSADEAMAEEQKALIAAMVSDVDADNLEEKTQDSKPPAVEEEDTKPPAVEEEEEEEELEDLDEEELIPDFPEDEEVEEFEHDSLAQYEGVEFFVDENANVWDENKQYVGKYDEEEDALAIIEDYEPEDA